jgi:hypothetical protein
MQDFKHGGLYQCVFEREMFVPQKRRHTIWTMIGMLPANTPFVLLEAKENKTLGRSKKRGCYVDLKILTPKGEICFIFCFSDLILKVETKNDV